MDTEGSFNGRVHRDATKLANGGEREDVGQRVGIVPDSPKFLMSPTSNETWVPQLVWTFNWLLLRLMLVRKFGFLKTETVD